MTHTPAPWSAEFVGSTSAGFDAVDVYEITAGNGQRRVAEYVSADDARLIAAAPDLLAALSTLDSIERGMQGWHDDAKAEAWAKARAALAKAKGEA